MSCLFWAHFIVGIWKADSRSVASSVLILVHAESLQCFCI